MAVDGKENPNQDVLKQAPELDMQGEYVRKWVPELSAVPPKQIHQPWLLTLQQQKEIGLTSSIYTQSALRARSDV